MANEKKIIIDEDWKSQVVAEKEAARNQPSAGVSAASSGAPPAMDASDIEMPVASFELLLTTLATEALVALGQIPHPITGEFITQRDQAKYLIDTIEVLQDKTKGNLTSDERQMVTMLLHQLRLAFVETANLKSSPSGAPSVDHPV